MSSVGWQLEVDWPGVIEAGLLRESRVDNINRLADVAKVGNWEVVFRLFDRERSLSVNQWRIAGDSWFTPLHQAAWLGASSEVVDELIRRGAWRSLRNAEGDRPIVIALKRNHQHLADALTVRDLSDNQLRKFAAWDKHLSELIQERTESLEPVKIRPIPSEIIALETLDNLYFGYPGMYGGFSMSIFKGRLLVESWSRVVDGSGQAHVITESGCVLVEEGFV
ncbi:ankyrin repeat domain-containing protein [Leucobacter triazinivorans]|uniref:ankyrin repeat domain-containing protein n=1 Tax=Leucobacter triazinivorans TaxID=1784719 RepID=UPI001981BB37|nr:ankyrin repeat domain-containing protein [Leucobacter triazinivorans]